MFESFEEGARREVFEETGLKLDNVKFVSALNIVFEHSVPPRHYVDVQLCAHATKECELENKEPDKCEGWEWVSPEDLMDDTGLYRPLFVPLRNMFVIMGLIVE